MATRLLFEGKRCVGVAFRQSGRRSRSARGARGDPVRRRRQLAASAADLRHRPGRHLQSIGVPVVHDLPGVGANLNDHYVARISHRVEDAVTINQLARGMRLARRGGALARPAAAR